MIVIRDLGWEWDGLGLRGAELENAFSELGLLISRVAVLFWWSGVTLICRG